MKHEELDEQLCATVEVARRGRDAAGPRWMEPAVGRVFLSRRTVDYPVEWLVIERDGDGCVVVPMDSHPFVGSRDLALVGDGARVVRCDLEGRVGLEGELWVGEVSGEEMEAVRGLRQAMADGSLVATLREEEVDSDPEYVLWREGTVKGALRALEREEISNVLPFLPTQHEVPREPAWRRWGPWVAAAAAVVLAVVLGWQVQRMGRWLASERAELAEVERARQVEVEAAREAREEVGALEVLVRETEAASAVALAGLRSELEERFESLVNDQIVVNLKSFVLDGGARERSSRGLPEILNLQGASRFTLSLEVANPAPFFRYRLRLFENGADAPVWESDRLVKLSGKWFRLDLPAERFKTGVEYEFQIEGIDRDGRSEALKERYTVQVNR